MIAADIEVIFVSIAAVEDACLKVVAAWWGDSCVS